MPAKAKAVKNIKKKDLDWFTPLFSAAVISSLFSKFSFVSLLLSFVFSIVSLTTFVNPGVKLLLHCQPLFVLLYDLPVGDFL